MSLKASLERARRRYLARRSTGNLRAYLVIKARLRRWDDRYCSYWGVDPRVTRGCRRAIMRAFAAGIVPTATTGGQHAPGSFHGRRNARGEGQAVDLGLRRELVGTAKGADRLVRFQRAELGRRRRGAIKPVELLGPDNRACVLRGVEVDLLEGTALEQQHDNHVHEAYLI